MPRLPRTLALPLVLAAGLGAAEPAPLYPPDAGVLDARSFGAVGDGVADDTAALQKALTAGVDGHRIVALPPGTYLVRDTLRWKHDHEEGASHGWGRFLQLRGAGSGLSIIRLAPSAPGFGDAEKPKAVVQTGSSGSHGDKQYWNGEGNEAFMNHLRGFAVEVGPGNPGAIGISYQASNSGAMRDVVLRAAAGSGATGIDLTRRDNGPGLLSRIEIHGFAVGIRAGQEICQFSAEHVLLDGQREVGIADHDAVLALRKVESRNAVPALRVTGVGLATLLDSNLAGGTKGAAAVVIAEEGRAIFRDVATAGYGSAVDLRGTAVPTVKGPLWTSDPVLGAFPDPKPAQRLPVRDTPAPALPPASGWELVAAPNGRDDSDAILAAFASRKPVVAFRQGGYRIGRTLDVPPHVRWILGLGSTIDMAGDNRLADDAPVLRFAGGAASDTTVVDAFWIGTRHGLFIRHEDPRSVVVRDCCFIDSRVYAGRGGPTTLFIEDVAGSGYDFAAGSTVYARQWNDEGPGEPKTSLVGTKLWTLGFKCEGAERVFDIGAGSKVEAYGGLIYTFGADQRPAMSVTDSDALLSFAGTTYMPDGYFKVLMHERRGAVEKDLHRDAVLGRHGGRSLVCGVARAP